MFVNYIQYSGEFNFCLFNQRIGQHSSLDHEVSNKKMNNRDNLNFSVLFHT